MGVASGCGEQEAGVDSGSGWNLWVWLYGGIYIYLSTTILYLLFFAAASLLFVLFLIIFFVLVPVLIINKILCVK